MRHDSGVKDSPSLAVVEVPFQEQSQGVLEEVACFPCCNAIGIGGAEGYGGVDGAFGEAASVVLYVMFT